MSEEINVISPADKDGYLKSENGPIEEHNPKPTLESYESPSVETIDVPAKHEDAEENKQSIEPVSNEEQYRAIDLRIQESNRKAVDSSQELHPTDLENKSDRMEEHNPKPALHPGESPSSESTDVPAEHEDVQEDRQLNEPVPNEEQNKALDLRIEVSNVEAVDSSSSEKHRTTSDIPTETETLEKTNDIDQPAMKPTSSTEISPSLTPTSDKSLKEVTEDMQLINEGIKDIKLSEQKVAGSLSAKRGRKPAGTPRAKSFPVKLLTSPPLTRSRSRDLMKFPSTPASPVRLSARKGSESDSDEIKGARGRQRVKKN